MHAEVSKIDGTDQRIGEAREALSGWLYLQDHVQLDQTFVQAVNKQTQADFGVINPGNIMHKSAATLYDAVMVFARACGMLSLAQVPTLIMSMCLLCIQYVLQCRTNTTAILETMKRNTCVGTAFLHRAALSGACIPFLCDERQWIVQGNPGLCALTRMGTGIQSSSVLLGASMFRMH